jgi:plastocyanin
MVMNYRIALLLAFVVVASGCLSQKVEEPAYDRDSSGPADTNTIYFTGSGFTPSNVVVEQGDTVTWVNNASSTSMWVASDQHPTHKQYSGTSLSEHCNSDKESFDQCSTGDEYSFTFDRKGEWTYHNHDPFVKGGTVKVE